MDIQFKTTDAPVSSSNLTLTYGEIFIENKTNYNAIWGYNDTNNLVKLVEGWDGVYYRNYYYINALSILEDLNLTSVLPYDLLIYNQGYWSSTAYPFVSLDATFSDIDFLTYVITSTSFTASNTPSLNDSIVYKDNKFVRTKNFVVKNLPDGGNFDTSEVPKLIFMPDGGSLKSRAGYVYSLNIGTAGGAPDALGEFGSSATTYLRLFPKTSENENFPVADFGGLYGTSIPSPGMKVTVYGNAYAGDHYLTSYAGTATWTTQSGYYQIRVAQNLTTLLTGATAIVIHRKTGPTYEWES